MGYSSSTRRLNSASKLNPHITKENNPTNISSHEESNFHEKKTQLVSRCKNHMLKGVKLVVNNFFQVAGQNDPGQIQGRIELGPSYFWHHCH